jgi:hypothetical protein
MLIKLSHDQIELYWDMMKGDIQENMPPIADWGTYDPAQTLYALLIGSMQAWMFLNNKQEPQGFVTTVILDDVSGVKTLLLYHVILWNLQDKTNFDNELNTLKIYAYNMGCSKIGAFVMNEKLLAILKEHEVETRFVFAHLNI